MSNAPLCWSECKRHDELQAVGGGGQKRADLLLRKQHSMTGAQVQQLQAAQRRQRRAQPRGAQPKQADQPQSAQLWQPRAHSTHTL